MKVDIKKQASQKEAELEAATETYGLEPVLTAEEVASFLRMDRKSVYQAVAEGTLPGHKVGRRIVIFRDALLEFLRPKCACHSSKKGKPMARQNNKRVRKCTESRKLGPVGRKEAEREHLARPTANLRKPSQQVGSEGGTQ